MDDRVLALEMVIEVARADIERIRNINSRLLGFSFFIEEKQTNVKYAIACFHGLIWCLTRNSHYGTNFI